MKSVCGARIAGALFLGTVLLASGGCGYKNPPVPPETVVPTAIEDLRYTVLEDGVRMTWTYPLETIKGTDIREVSSFDLYRAELPLEDYCPTCPVPFTEPIEVDGGQTVVDGKRRVATYDYDMLRSGHKYFFKVRTRTGWWATSADSNIITFVWYIPAIAPAGLSASAADSRVSLSWQPVTSLRDGKPVTTDVLYQVLRRSGEGSFNRLGKPVETTGFVDGAVTNGQEYSYQVQSVLRFGEDLVYGGISTDITVTPVDTTPPPAPTGVQAFETGQGIRVIWDVPADDDVAGYRIYRRTADSDTFTPVGSVDLPSTTFIDAEVREDLRYYYAVTAIDGSAPPNESARSQEATPRY